MKTTEELQVLIEIVEAVNYFKTQRKRTAHDLNKPVYHFMKDKLKHKIDIYTRCIERLNQRYNNLIK